MQALVFLTVKSLLNGMKRSLTSARRLIGLLFFLSYYVLIFVRPFGSPPQPTPERLPMQFDLPPLEVLSAGVFALFGVIAMFQMLGLLGYRGGFRPADVDVLFPTPVSPKLVMGFRLTRDYLFSLLVPLVFVALGWRGVNTGMEAVFRSFPEHGHLVFRTMLGAWLFMSLAWVCIGYAISLFVFRSDTESERNARIAGFSLVTLFLAVVLLVGLSIYQDPSVTNLVKLGNDAWLRTVLFLPAFAALLTMAPLEGNLIGGLVGLFGLLMVIAGSIRIAIGQVPWLYDQAAAKGFEVLAVADLQRKGDSYGLLAEQARRGKLRQGRVAGWIAGHTAIGPRAILWKDLVLQARSGLWSVWFVVALGLAGIILMMLLLRSMRPEMLGLVLFLGQGFLVFMTSISLSSSGFIEFLRRVDVMKPLPISSSVLCLWESVGKIVVPTLACVLSCVPLLIFRLDAWQYVVVSLFLAPSFALLLVSTILLVTVLFPDHDDPTQRGFRGLVTLLAIAMFALPGAALVVVLLALQLPPLLAGLPALLANAAAIAIALFFAGNLYAAYNPSE